MKNGLYYMELIVGTSIYDTDIETYFVKKTDIGIIVLNNSYENLEIFRDTKAFKCSMVYDYRDFDKFTNLVYLGK